MLSRKQLAAELAPEARVTALEAENAALRARLTTSQAVAASAIAKRNGALARDVAADAAARAALAKATNAALRQENAELIKDREGLHDREQRLSLILASITDYAIYVTDLERRVTEWNEGAHRLLGWSEAEILGRQVDVIYTREDRTAADPQKEAEAAFRDGHARNERWQVRRDGSRFWGSGMEMPLFNAAGQKQGFVKIMRDRTEQHAAQGAAGPADG
jgi:PAS domain S-box-containing protein